MIAFRFKAMPPMKWTWLLSALCTSTPTNWKDQEGMGCKYMMEYILPATFQKLGT